MYRAYEMLPYDDTDDTKDNKSKKRSGTLKKQPQTTVDVVRERAFAVNHFREDVWGDKVKGYVKSIRRLDSESPDKINKLMQAVYAYMQIGKGFLPAEVLKKEEDDLFAYADESDTSFQFFEVVRFLANSLGLR